MKLWIILLIFLAGSALTITGGVLEMQNTAGASWLMNISLLLQVVAVSLLIVKLITRKKAK